MKVLVHFAELMSSITLRFHLKIVVSGFFLTLVCSGLVAQTITNYSFSSTSGTFSSLSSPTATTWTGTTDEGGSGWIPIGFDFWYMGVRYTQISASTNGWLALGSTQSDYLSTNNLSSSGAPRPVIAPLWDNLDIVDNTRVTYKTTGTAGSRIFTIQYLNVKWNYQASGSVISFQVKMYEGSGKVEFVYKSESTSVKNSSASIGITAASTGTGKFLSVNNSGSGVSSTTESNVTSKPGNGKTYTFTPPIPSTPGNLSFTNVASTTMTINWADNASNESGYVLYRSTDGVSYAFVGQTAANAISSSQSGLSSGSTYYWKVYAVSEGGLSAVKSGSQATCTPPSPPTVSSPVNYCMDATAVQLSATGTNLSWGGYQGTVGGTSSLTGAVYVDNSFNNRKLLFTTSRANVVINTVDYYIPAYQAVSGLVLSIYNNSGTVIATSSSVTTTTAGASVVKVTNTFGYTITNAGSYSIGISAGTGNIGSDSPVFPVSESSNTIILTGISSAGYRCFNNIEFTLSTSTTAPTPSTLNIGSFDYLVTQTSAGCTSAPATITVNVTSSPDISQVSDSFIVGFYKLDGNANDATGNNNGALQNAPSATADRFGISSNSYAFNGTSQFVSTTLQYVTPAEFTVSIWFKTNTASGGKLIGFGNSQTGTSSQYDRHIYMNNAGQLYFGVYPGSVKTVNSPLSYNDNTWHLATATLSATNGMVLYIDGTQVAADPATLTAESTTGYWRIGFDNNNGWTSQPSSFYFNGKLDDALIYHRALSAAEVATIYRSPQGAGNNGPVCLGSSVSLTVTPVAGATYAWTGPDGFTSSQPDPTFAFTTANTGVYMVEVSKDGCTSIAYTNVVTSNTAGQWTGEFSTDWADANNWCSGTVPTTSTNVVIPAGATRMPEINSSVACKDLIISAGASLTTKIAGTLNISGALSNTGTMTNEGTTNFNGATGQQTFSGVNTFYNLILSNPGGLLISGAITVNNDLTIASGTLSANNFQIFVGGSWTNNAAANGFAAGTSSVTFNGSGAQFIGGAYATTFNHLAVSNSGNTVSLNVNTVVAGSLTIASGTFNLGTYTANRILAGGELSLSNNATLKIGGTNTFPSNYAANTLLVASTVEYSGTNQVIAAKTYGNLILSSASGAAVKTMPATGFIVAGNLSSVQGSGSSVTFTADSDITINGNVSIGSATTFNGGSYTHNISGNWVNMGTFNGNTSTIILSGTGTSVNGAGTENFNSLTIAASNISLENGDITLSGNLTTTGAGEFIQLSGNTLTMTGTGKTINGAGIMIENLTVSGIVSTASSFKVSGNLSVSGSLNASAGSINLFGASKTFSGPGTINFAGLSVTGSISTSADFSISSNLSISGALTATSGTATFTGSTYLNGIAHLYNVEINGTSLQLSANAELCIANTLTITAGTLNVSASTPNTVNFNGSGAQNINAITYNNLKLSNSGDKTASGGVTVQNGITIGAGTTFISGAYTHSIYNDWYNYGSFSAGSGTVLFTGEQNKMIVGATTFNNLTVNTDLVSTGVTLYDDVTASAVTMTQGTILTGENTITITGTRTGNGFILGNIRRTHGFSTGVAYAFEGPDNTITFSSVSSVNDVLVSVVKGSIGDFPWGASISREYEISIPSGTYDATLRLHYEEEELNSNDESSLVLWNSTGGLWLPYGKTANSTTANYVEQSGLTDLSLRWSCSNNPDVAEWNGSVSPDWSNAANWTSLLGSPSLPPSASDVAVLGTAYFNHQPAISSTVTVKNILFGDVQAVNLSMTDGGVLTTGDIVGVWSGSLAHTFDVNDQTVTVQGDLAMSDGSSGHTIDLYIGAGTLNLQGSLYQAGGADIVFSGGGNLNITGDFNHIEGALTPGSGTVTYNGVTNQHIGVVDYYNLVIDNAGAAVIIMDTLNIGGNLTLHAGELDNLSITRILGNVTIDEGAILHNHSMLHVGGNWLNNGTYNSNISHIHFDGAGTQSISASTFNSLFIQKPVGSVAILTGNIQIKDNLTVTSGTFDIDTFSCNRITEGGTITLADSATFIVGANNAPLNFTSGVLATSSTVIADGTAPQLIYGLEFGNLVFRNGGYKTLITPIKVNGDLVIENGATFDGGSQVLDLHGNWVNNGTFVPSANTLLLNGTSKSIFGNTTFNSVVVTGTYNILSNTTFNTLLEITATGSLSSGAGIQTMVNGDLTNKGTLYTLGTGTFSGNTLQTLSLINAVQTVVLTVNFNGSVSPILSSTSAPQFGYLNINNTGGVNPSIGWTVLYDMTVGSGASFNGGNYTHNFLGAVTNNGTMTSNGILNFIPGSATTIHLGSNFTSTGKVVFDGTGAMTLTGTPDTFHEVLISNSNIAGVSPAFDWNIEDDITVSAGTTLNAGNYTYTIAGNFLNNGTFNSGTSTIVLDGASHQDIYSSSALHDLTIDKSGGEVTLFTNATVNGNLHFVSGILETGDKTLMLGASGSVTGAAQNTGWVNGFLGKYVATGATAKTYEVGDANFYTPASAQFANVSAAGTLVVQSIAGDHPAISTSDIRPGKSVNRYWNFEGTGINFSTYSIAFQYPVTDLDAGASSAGFGINLFTGSTWVTPSTTSATDTMAQASAFRSFGAFAIGETCNEGTSIYYGSSPCCSIEDSAVVTLIGNAGGIFSAASGLSLNTSTGSVDIGASTPGTYSVTYTIAATGECPLFITSAGITINEAPTAEGSYVGTPFCSNEGIEYPTGSGTAGGVFSAAAGLSINASTGGINLATSTAGSYTVSYTIAAAEGCPEFTWTTDLDIMTAPAAAISYPATVFCANAGPIAVTLDGTSGGTYHGSAMLALDTISGLIDPAASAQGNYTIFYNIDANGGCGEYQTATEIDIVTPGTWSGEVSSDWSESSNWICGAVPTSSINAIIPDSMSHDPLLDSGTGSVYNLTIENGASLTVADATLQIAGSIDNNGTMTAVAGNIEMNGGTAQTIPASLLSGNVLKGLIINSTDAVTLNGPLYLTDFLRITEGSLQTGGYLTLQSSAVANARVEEITSASGNPVNGNVLVERFVPGRRKYRLLTSSVTTSANAVLNTGEEAMSIWGNWQNQGDNITGNVGTFITGGISADGFDTQTGNPSLFTYDDSNRVYVPFSSASGKNTKYTPLKAGVAYYMFIYGDRLNSVYTSTPNHTVLKTFGSLLTGDQEYHTGSKIPLSNVTGRFTLLGNPFVCPINWATLPRTNLSNTYWGWDPNLSNLGGYVTVSTLGNIVISAPYSGSTGLNQYIQPGQGFFVRTTAALPTLSIREQDKVSNFNGTVFLNGETASREAISLLAVNLQYITSDETRLADGVVAVFGDNFSNPAGDEDAVKIFNPNENVAIQNGTATLSIDARKQPQTSDTIFLKMTKLAKPEYTLQIFVQQMDPAGALPYLHDNYLNTTQVLSIADTNYIDFSVPPDIPAAVAADRFCIVFQEQEATSTLEPMASKIQIFPNPVSDHRIHVEIKDAPPSICNFRLTNPQGQQLMMQEMEHPGGRFVKNLVLDKNILPGVYFLEIETGAGNTTEVIFID